VARHRTAGQNDAVARAFGRDDRRGPEGRRVGIETENDAAATLLDERREPVGEVRSRSRRPRWT
jgi:hypothetical protein